MTPWTPETLAGTRRDFEAGEREDVIAARYDKSPGQIRGKAITGQWHRPASGRAKVLRPNLRAVVTGRTIFPGQVKPAWHGRVLTPGRDQRKLGARVTKGEWSGMPLYALTLEERATCPRSCHHWRSCMGNTMQWSIRLRHGWALEAALESELEQLSVLHPGGFVVRLHILGDFYSLEYVRLWARWLDRFPALRVFGYTARGSDDPIGRAVHRLARRRWSRFAVRQSCEEPGPGRTITLWADDGFAGLDTDQHVIICPAEDGKTPGCGTCGLCWSPAARDATIAFIAHGGA